MTPQKKILIVVGAVLALVIVVVALTRTTEDGSGPPPVPSPDGNYVVQASSYLRHRPFSSEPVRARILILSKDGVLVRQMVVAPLRTNDPYYFRNVPDLVRWEPDSKTVTIAFDGAEHRISVDK